jgi:paraquat-inducible protein B
MTSPERPDDLDQVPEAVVDEEHKGLPVVWLLPIIALLVGGWLIYKTYSEKGPEIVISFRSATGLEEGKTQVKLKDVKVGEVESVVFSRDLTEVLVTVSMAKGAAPYLTDKTRFWVVRPRVDAGKVTGLETLVSGAYIAIDPDDTGRARRRFTGLEKPPVITGDRKGTSYRLKASKAGSLSVGSPVYIRQIAVGEVTDYRLSDNHDYVEVGVFIESPHDQYVKEGTRFWNASGLEMSLSASGVKIEMDSVVSLVTGGISFETPVKDYSGRAPEGHMFTLFDNHAQALEQPITQATTFALRFSDSVRGLDVGAPVEFRGIRLGTVKSIEVAPDPSVRGNLAPVVLIDYEPQRLISYLTDSGEAEMKRREKAVDAVERAREQVEESGLRARLQVGNLITGKAFVELDYFANTEPVKLTKFGPYLEIPTVPSSLEGILGGIQRILDRLDKADLAGTVVNLNQLMTSTSNLMAVLEKDAPVLSEEVRDTLQDARTTLREASSAFRSASRAASPRGEIGNQLQQALKEIASAARSIRVMAEYLERHPDAMLKGKGTK